MLTQKTVLWLKSPTVTFVETLAMTFNAKLSFKTHSPTAVSSKKLISTNIKTLHLKLIDTLNLTISLTTQSLTENVVVTTEPIALSSTPNQLFNKPVPKPIGPWPLTSHPMGKLTKGPPQSLKMISVPASWNQNKGLENNIYFFRF